MISGSSEEIALREWLHNAESVAISAPAWSEFLCGPVSFDAIGFARDVVGEPLTYGGAAAARAASLFNQSGRRRGSLIDCMIAAVAIEADASLATANPRDFQRLKPMGLRLAQAR